MMKISFQGLQNEVFKHVNHLCFEQVMSLESYEISQQQKIETSTFEKNWTIVECHSQAKL